MPEPEFTRHDGSGVCDVCGVAYGPKEAYLVPVDTFYASPKYKERLRRMGESLFQSIGLGIAGIDFDAEYARMKAMDKTEFSAVCPECISLFT